TVLSAEISNTHTQSRNLEKLQQSIGSRIEILDRNLNYRRTNNPVTPEQMLSGKSHMDQIRTTVAMMQAEEQAVLQARTDTMNKFASYTPVLIVFSALLAICITLIFFRKVSQDFKEKTILTEKVEQKNLETENRLIAIENVAAQISGGDYNILLDQNAKDSLGSVAGPLNRMAESLQTSFKTLEEKEWLSSAVAKLNDRMMGEKTMEKLAADILDSITE